MQTKYKLSANPLALAIVCISGLIISLCALNSCGGNATSGTAEDDIAEGKELAQRYCISCHQLPDPAQLDKKTWEHNVLPAMAKRLKVQRYMGEYFADRESLITGADFKKIAAYFKAIAPEKLAIPQPAVKPLQDAAIFSVIRPEFTDTSKGHATTTFVSFNPVDRMIYSADVAKKIYAWDKDLRSKKLIAKMPSPVASMVFSKEPGNTGSAVITCIGDLPPFDSYKGKLMELNLSGNLPVKEQLTIADSLPRPVFSVAADFNKDGLTDYVVCGFGHEPGGLYLVQQRTDHQFKKTTIRNVPGAEQLITGDFNNDGWTDVMCLFAQADEGLFMFLNDHKGGFITRNIMHFPAIYGSSSFQLVDFNHDGKPDILYTCGDNSDFSTVLKPYHGLYIFTNQGDWTFKQTYFYHINGATKATAVDFDHDGDLDIAVIAFFADFKYHPQQGFTYFEQTKQGQFLVHELPVNDYGRWLTMDVADVDGDGYADVILGNFSIDTRGYVNQRGFTPKWDKFEPLIVLKNDAVKIKSSSPVPATK